MRFCEKCGNFCFKRSLCEQCYENLPKIKAQRKEYRKRKETRERNIAYLSKYRQIQANKEKNKKYLKKWRNTKFGKEYMALWSKSPRHRNQQKEYEQSEKFKIKRRAYIKTPKGKAIQAIQQGRRRTIKKAGNLTPDQWLGIKYQSPICPMCGRFVECENLTLDHIIPLAKGGEHTKKNVQALCKSCNSRKWIR